MMHRRSENSPSTTQNSPAKFRSFPERALLFHNNSPVTLHCSPATTILNENPAVMKEANQRSSEQGYGWHPKLIMVHSFVKQVYNNILGRCTCMYPASWLIIYNSW